MQIAQWKSTAQASMWLQGVLYIVCIVLRSTPSSHALLFEPNHVDTFFPLLFWLSLSTLMFRARSHFLDARQIIKEHILLCFHKEVKEEGKNDPDLRHLCCAHQIL